MSDTMFTFYDFDDVVIGIHFISTDAPEDFYTQVSGDAYNCAVRGENIKTQKQMVAIHIMPSGPKIVYVLPKMVERLPNVDDFLALGQRTFPLTCYAIRVVHSNYIIHHYEPYLSMQLDSSKQTELFSMVIRVCEQESVSAPTHCLTKIWTILENETR